MKKLFLIICITISFNCFSQETQKSEVEAVQTVVNKFFKSLAKQDTVVLKEVAFMEGQIWTVNNTVSPARHRMRFFKDDLKTFKSNNTFYEEAYIMEVKIHQGMAMAWVPYEFRLNGEFSHCGVDVFTLVKEAEKWKIISLSYSIDKDGCEELKGNK